MSLTESRLYRETLAAAIAFHARKLWLEHGDDECFAMVVPGEEHPVFASIMGQAGREFGLVLFRGPTVGSDLMDVLGSDEPENAFQDDLTFLSFSMTRYEDVAPEGRSFLARAGVAGRRQDIVPFFFAKEPGKAPRKLTQPEVKTYLYALKGTLKAKEAGLLVPMPFRPGEETLTLLLSGDPLDPEVTTECRRLGSSGAEETHVDEREDIVPAPDDLDGWKRCDQRLFRRAQGRLKETVDSHELALELYFGSRDAYRRFLNDPNDQFPSTCFFEWYWHDHRVASTGMSLAERMLSGALPQAERLLLEARLRAVPSLFKVERIEKGKSLTVLDVLFGGETMVYDKALSESATVNMGLAARVFPAGSFHLVSPLGPPLAPLELDGALGFLQHL